MKRRYDDWDLHRSHDVDCPHCNMPNVVFLQTTGFLFLKVKSEFKHKCDCCKKEFTVYVQDVPKFLSRNK